MKNFSLPELREDLKKALPPEHPYSDQIDRALALAYQAHDGQVREHRDPDAPPIPYIVHPVGVAKIASEMWTDGELADSFDDIVSAALTHDVLEDSAIDLSDLANHTSKRAADIVLALTKPRLTKALSREARNRAFAEQISGAGAAARYIKLCDALHNLARPAMMPYSLLEKTIGKAGRQYLPLAHGQPFEERLSTRLQDRIAKAETLAREHRENHPKFDASDLDRLLDFCIRQSRGKVLEAHDIIEIIDAIPGIVFCAVAGFDAFAEERLRPLLDGNGQALKPQKAGKWVEAGEIPLKPPLFDPTAVRDAGSDRVFIAPLGGIQGGISQGGISDTDSALFVFAGVADRIRPDWLTPRTLLAVVNILSERLRARENRELAEYAETLIHFGLDLDPRLAQKHALSQPRMSALKNQLEAGRFVHRNLRTAFEFMIRAAGIEDMVDRIESRVKMPASILQKVHARKLADYGEIDDLVGVRIIFASRKSRSRFLSAFQSDLDNLDGELAHMAQTVTDSVSIEEIGSMAGYRAVHIRIQVKAPSTSLQFVSCEIQLRTLFEDAWARLSQISFYKKQFGARNRLPNLLKDLAVLRDQCEDRVSRDL
uniref:HD domain-containing protein n=1 Tax=Candidatus Kentrum sp. DK TaxID=2126562 RepID=A0A450TGN7_9GAMM|nr:MAG: HD domain-containing protein [Candidatus Kentron sp. DK]